MKVLFTRCRLSKTALSSVRYIGRIFSVRVLLVVLGLVALSTSLGYCWQSSIVYYDRNGNLVYTEDADGNRIPDFSHAGYRGGGVELPEVPVKKIISPIAGDNTAHIQAAIDAVAAMPLDSDGFRGAVQLEPGTYTVNGTLRIYKTGVVVRGAGDGDDTATNTIIHRPSSLGSSNLTTVVSIASPSAGDYGSWPQREIPGTRSAVTTDWVKVGSDSFAVQDASGFSVGDNIVILHPATQAWLDAVDRGATDTDDEWSVSDSLDIACFRYITGIEGNTLTIHAPVFNHLQRALSQSYVYKFNRSHLITEVGLENVRIFVETKGPEDTDHAEHGVVFGAVENGWAANVTVLHAQMNLFRFEQSFHITCQNCKAIEPHSPISGGYRSNFGSEGSQFVLVRDCLATYGRHSFVVNGCGRDSGNVFLDCVGINPYATSEGHRRWTNGNLWDNVVFEQVNSGMDVIHLGNRGSWGTGHGWASVHSVAWNCDAADGHIHIEQPPTAQNYGIGCFGAAVNGPGPFGHPQGFVEGTNQPGLEPRSLYLAQLDILLRGVGIIAGHWEFDESSGVIAGDSSPNGNDGTLHNMADTDWAGGSLDFDGINDYVKVPSSNNLNLTSGFTISGLIKPNIISKMQGIVTKVTDASARQYALLIDGEGRLLFEYERAGNAYSLSGGTALQGQWQHVSATVDNSLGIKLYLNGREVASATAPVEVDATPDPLCIGRRGGNFGRNPLAYDYFDGSIDEVIIFNVVLSEDEIIRLYTQGMDSFNMPCGSIQLEEHLILSGDVNRDCSVNWHDVLLLVGNWLVDGVWAGDIYRDGKVDMFDFTELANKWNQYIAPAIPSGVTAIADFADQVDLSWDNNTESNFEYYRVYRSTDSGFSPGTENLIADSLAGTTLADTGLLPETTYYYRVTAVNTAGFESYACDEISATTDPLDTTPRIKYCTAGAEQEGNWKENSYDGNTSTRWANDNTIGNAWIEYDLGQSWEISGIRLLLYNRTSRTYPIEITIDETLVWSGSTSTTSGYWEQSFTPMIGQHIKLAMTGNNSDGRAWFTFYEIEILAE